MTDSRSTPHASKDTWSVADVTAPLLERWRTLVLTGAGATVLAAGALLLLGKRYYRASVTVAAVTSSRTPSLSGLGSLTGLVTPTGFAVTPDLIAALAVSRRVLLDVADLPADSGSAERIAWRLSPRLPANAPSRDIAAAVRNVVAVSVDKRTGLIALGVDHPDSALARRTLAALVDATSRTVAGAARAQASIQRQGLALRVDSAGRQLERVERELVVFTSSHRYLAPYSLESLEHQRLQRAITVAQQAYLQAVTEQGAALARELEQIPAVVIVDPVSPDLDRLSRRIALRSIGFGIVAFALVVLLILVRDAFRLRADDATPSWRRLMRASQAVPGLRRLVDEPRRRDEG